ncbi:hypothetical protein WMF31_23120 [Sorangium sp. So ce1036]|uniref:hypothetical protein n=1 Tax=Sorangium sp. So ce1036 TaxID=3133328 RepID=UPI003F053536
MTTHKNDAPGPVARARGPRAGVRALAGVAAVAAALASARSARAEDDGAYGRLDGDLELRAGAGATFASGGPALCARGAAVYLATAGVYAHYTDALGADAAPIARSIAGGVFIQPLFLARYASDLERGAPWLNLLVDSFALGVGSFWEASPGGGLAPEPGLELSASLDLPLLGDATGPFLGLRGALRWRGPELAGIESAQEEQRALVSVTLSWHHVVWAHLVDAGDRSSARGRARAQVAASGGAAGAGGR